MEQDSATGANVRGLSEEIKDKLAARDETNSLKALISLSINLDNHLRERRGEQRDLRGIHSFPPSLELAGSAQANPSVLNSVPFPSLPGALEEPMQLGRACLTPAEWQRNFKFKSQPFPSVFISQPLCSGSNSRSHYKLW